MKKNIKRILSTAVATTIIAMPVASLAANIYVGNVGFNADRISNESVYRGSFQDYLGANFDKEVVVDDEFGSVYYANDASNTPGTPVDQLTQRTVPAGAKIWDGTGTPGEVVQDFVLELSVDTTELKADGKTVMQVTGELIGEGAENFEGMAIFESQRGLASAQKESAFDKGKVVFNVTLPNSKVDIEDVINLKIKSHGTFGEYDLVGTKSAPKAVVYLGFSTQGSETLVKSYSIDKVRSADVADRVVVYVGNVAEEDFNNEKRLENLKAAIVDQVKVYTKDANTNADNEKIDLVEVIDTKEVSGGYAFTVLTELPAYAEDRSYSTTPNILIDNQYNYYYVSNSTTDVEQGSKDNIKLSTLEKDNLSRFILVDKVKPEIRAVKASDNDGIKLPNNSLLITFSEGVNRLTAENPANWVINGNKLKASDVKSIKVLDIDSIESSWTSVKTGKGLERSQVVLTLTPEAAKTLLVTGENLIQARSIADWAGMYDLSDNNKITTQDFKFDYKVVAAVSESVNPYILWAYSDDDKAEIIDGETVYNDYVYVLYSRPMSIEAIRASTYDVNGKQVNQDADITRTNIDLYEGDKGNAQLVTIKLPSDFIIGGDDIDGDRDGLKRKNVLTIPENLQAIDDGVEATSESLMFDNNEGSNQFELSFFKDNTYTELLKVSLNPASKEFFNPSNHSGVAVDPEPGVDKPVATIKVTQPGVLLGEDKVLVTLTGVSNTADYAISFGATKFKRDANGQFVGVVKTGTTADELTIEKI